MGNPSVAVVNFMKCDNLDTHVASNRIAVWLAKALGAFLIDRGDLCAPVRYDQVVIVNGPFGFCDFREKVQALVELNQRIVWVANEITLDVPSQIKKFLAGKSISYWCNYDNHKNWPNYRYVNWNTLTFVPGLKWREPKYRGLAYYGAFREDRVEDFKRYLGPKVPYPVFISSSAKGLQKFRKINPKAQAFNMTNLIRDFGAFEAALYIEDEKTHSIYNSPANRFYECLSAGVLQLFDHQCVGTFKRAGIDVTPWLVDGPASIPAFRANYNPARFKQRQLYENSNFHQQLWTELKAAKDSSF